MNLVHESIKKSTTVLNIALLQVVPHLLNSPMILKTHDRGLIQTSDNGTHHFPSSMCHVSTRVLESSFESSEGGLSVKSDRQGNSPLEQFLQRMPTHDN
jgi:hypothetical protein